MFYKVRNTSQRFSGHSLEMVAWVALVHGEGHGLVFCQSLKRIYFQNKLTTIILSRWSKLVVIRNNAHI